MTSDSRTLPAEDVARIDAEASVLMKRGMALMADPRADAPAEALGCFDRALALRRELPTEADPTLQYGLAACWLNRAEALMRMGSPDDLSEAARAFHTALPLLEALPLGDDARFPRRLAIAYQNCGLVSHAQGSLDAAVDAFKRATAVLESNDSTAIPDRTFLMAVTSLNLAHAYAARLSESIPLVRRAAGRAIEHAADLERRDPNFAEVGLRARQVLCQTFAYDIQRQHQTGTIAFDDIHGATDAVDDGLELVQRWEQRGVGRFREAASGLFRFGALVYGNYQPQFLDEFIESNLDPALSSLDYVESAEIRAAADDVRALQARVPRPPSAGAE